MGTKKGAGQTAPTMAKPKPTEQAKNAIKLSEQYGELLSKTTQSYTCTRRR